MLARDRCWIALVPALLGLGLVAGCRSKSADAPVHGHYELCCKAANPDNVSFVGCRASDYCRAGEEVWVRGPVDCTATGECALAVELAVVEPEDQAEAPEDQADAPEADAQAPPAAEVVPVDLDYRAEPKLESMPTIICPATLERGVEGRVLLAIEVTAEGRVSHVEIREGLDPECDALARDALKNARFEPARTPSGEPIPSSTTWSYPFVAPADAGGAPR